MGRLGPAPRGRKDLRWQLEAACLGITNFLEDPEHEGWTNKQRIKLCKEECTVRNECLEYAFGFPATELDHNDLVFGGFTGRQIAKKLRDRKAAE